MAKIIDRIMDDSPYMIGSTTVKTYSVDHLRHDNPCASMSPTQVADGLKLYFDDSYGLAELANERLLENEGEFATDLGLIIKLIYGGNLYGLGASPVPSKLPDLLWQAAAIMMDNMGISHPNDAIEKFTHIHFHSSLYPGVNRDEADHKLADLQAQSRMRRKALEEIQKKLRAKKNRGLLDTIYDLLTWKRDDQLFK
ncbi:MAG: hypothetical protein KAJ19_29595 [Gammaproteobacteria bacterium]|nr:hypothetical protein [Gammaproteobacteria bacterium]